MTSEDINRRKLTKQETAQIQRMAAKQAAGDDLDIDYSDIPPLTDEQLRSAIRFRDRHTKIAVSVRLDPRVVAWLKSKGAGHLTRINDILMNLMEAESRRRPQRGM